VKLGSIAGLYLDLLGHFSAGVDPVALDGALFPGLTDLRDLAQDSLWRNHRFSLFSQFGLSFWFLDFPLSTPQTNIGYLSRTHLRCYPRG
jgi:hypothetical protein